MIYDLTQPIVSGMPVFPGDPEVRIAERVTAPPWQASELRLGSHSGTHVDAPRHYLATGDGIGAFPVDRFIRSGFVVGAPGRTPNEPLGTELLDSVRPRLRPGAVVVLRTGWDRYWGQERYLRHPYLSAELASALVDLGVGLVGIDALNVDSTADGGEDAHRLLLGGNVLIAENLRGVDRLTAGAPYVFAILPLALGAVDGAPARAVAWDIDHAFAGGGPA